MSDLLQPLPDNGDYGGSTEHQEVEGTPARLVILTEAGHLFHWHEDERLLRRITFTGVPKATVFPSHMHLSKRGLLVTLPDGRAMRGSFGPLRKPLSPGGNLPSPRQENNSGRLRKRSEGPGKGKESSGLAFAESRFLDHSQCQPVALTRIPQVSRCLAATSDPAQRNFSFVLQASAHHSH